MNSLCLEILPSPTYSNISPPFSWPPLKPTMNQVVLTCFVDARVAAELQHVEVSPLHAAPDAVDARDVRAPVLHGEQGSHHVIVPVMLEVRARHQEPRRREQERTEPGGGPPLQQHRGPLHQERAQKQTRRPAERDTDWTSLHAKRAAPSLSPPPLSCCPSWSCSPTASSCTYSSNSKEQVRTAPPAPSLSLSPPPLPPTAAPPTALFPFGSLTSTGFLLYQCFKCFHFK